MTNNVLFDVVRDGFQCLTIPRSGRYRFEVIGACRYDEHYCYSPSPNQGARIIGEVQLEKGEKITVALGQSGNRNPCGSGGTFVVKESGTSDPQPLFVAAGSGSTRYDCDFSQASLSQTASGNDHIGSSGAQQRFDIDGNRNDIYCCGAGFLEGPMTWELKKNSVAPKSYKDGLIGGKGKIHGGAVAEGGFGGGGACYWKNDGGYYHGSGGGYTGGGTELIYRGAAGGGGGSFAIDKEAQFDRVYEEYGKCTITYLESSDSLAFSIPDLD